MSGLQTQDVDETISDSDVEKSLFSIKLLENMLINEQVRSCSIDSHVAKQQVYSVETFENPLKDLPLFEDRAPKETEAHLKEQYAAFMFLLQQPF